MVRRAESSCVAAPSHTDLGLTHFCADVLWLHQPETTSSNPECHVAIPDLMAVAYHEHTDGSETRRMAVPLIVIEAALAGTDKRLQAFACVTNLLSRVPNEWFLPVLAVELLHLGNLEKIEFTIRGYARYQRSPGATPELAETTLVRAKGLPTLHRVLRLLWHFTVHGAELVRTDKAVAPHAFMINEMSQQSRVLVRDKVVFKEFDHRDKPEGAWKRDAEPNTNIPGAEVQFLDPEKRLAFLRYPFAPHTASPTLRHLADVIEHLAKLHSAGRCHGDIRLANIVLCNDYTIDVSTPRVRDDASMHEEQRQILQLVKSHLIDFDMSGEEGKRRYPPNYATELDDTERHPDAQPSALLYRVHDRYSMRWIMQQTTMPESGIQDRWRDILEAMCPCDRAPESELFEIAKRIREEFDNVRIQWRAKSERGC